MKRERGEEKEKKSNIITCEEKIKITEPRKI